MMKSRCRVLHKSSSRKGAAVGNLSAAGASGVDLVKPRSDSGSWALFLCMPLLLILSLLFTACSAAPAAMHAGADADGDNASIFSPLPVSNAEKPSEVSASVVAWINSEPITIGEWMPRMLELRSVIAAEWAPSSGDVNSDSFWYQAQKGQTPMEALQKLTLERFTEIKVLQIAARNAGIAMDISYQAFLANLESENSERKSRVAKGQTIYGPKQYSEKVYYAYTIANMVIRLKEHLGGAGDVVGSVSGQSLAHDAYESWLAEQLKAANIQINPPVYSRLLLTGLP
ncbi:hypothetical protein [Paenibacillus sinopodophylli]|uniref:hypothetical protein n=1 Tax=Paenibacillus sinopodophylli TaxID=1837342 RepID=UPI00110C8FFE|nr:hypothetical protein [Paenibacillus sinopodophylli]